MTFLHAMDGFFFRRISATGFGLMRSAWAAITLLFLLFQWNDVTYYYSESGIMPHWLEQIHMRSDYRFTILDTVDQPIAVFCLYLILLILLFCVMIGVRTRITTILSVLLLFSFHERNTLILGGGDTLLRTIGFILMIAPGIHAFGIDHLRSRTFRIPVTMPVWPWRLLLWQMIVLYATSTWTKLLGTMWLNGTAIQTTLHHPLFARFDPAWMSMLIPFSAFTDYAALLWQAAWLLLLIPRWFTDLLPPKLPRIPLLRLLMIGGILFHGAIFLLLDAGVFSLAVFVAYIGLLREEDMQWLRKVRSKELGVRNRKIVVLYDGQCGLCLRSLHVLNVCDWSHMLQVVDFRDAAKRKQFAPDVTEATLDKAMHIKLSDESYLTGFDAFRYLSSRLPSLWPLWLVLWFPGVAPIGRIIYAKTADSRKKCTHENCGVMGS